MNAGGMVRSLRWTMVAKAALLAVTTGPAAAATPPPSFATVTVDPGKPAGRLPSDFVGLSYEIRELGTGGFDARKGNLVDLFKTLNRSSSVRISGNTLDRDTLWVPAGQQPPSPLPA